jgi:hypothetical protein
MKLQEVCVAVIELFGLFGFALVSYADNNATYDFACRLCNGATIQLNLTRTRALV